MLLNRYLILILRQLSVLLIQTSMCRMNEKVTLFVTRCDIGNGVNVPCNPCHRQVFFQFDLDFYEILKCDFVFCNASLILTFPTAKNRIY